MPLAGNRLHGTAMHAPYSAESDIAVLPSYIPVPGLGVLPANAFVIQADQPVLVDAGLAADRGAFLAALRSVIDPRKLRWLWLTHTDPDHVGNLSDLLAAAPQMRIVTTFIGAGKLNLIGPVPMERLYLLNPGQELDVGDRRLRALRPPCYDAPETMGLFDPRSRALFSADCFGAIVDAPLDDARKLPADDLARSQRLWATVDSPWLEIVNRDRLQEGMELLRRERPQVVLSSHLPMARGLLDRLLDNLTATVGAAPFVGPDQAALEQASRPTGAEAPPPPA